MDEEHELPPVSSEMAHRKTQLQEQQAAMQRGETPSPLKSFPTADPVRWTQGTMRESEGNQGKSGKYPGNREGIIEGSKGGSSGSRGARRDRPVSIELPITEYIRLAAEKNSNDLKTVDAWQGSAWTFCRYMKSHPEFQGLNSRQAVDHLDQILENMFPTAQDPWEEVFDFVDSKGNAHDPFDHFVECWDVVENALGESPIEQAVRLAEQYPLELVGYRSKRWKSFRQFLSICRWLQVIAGDKPFFAPVRKFAELLDVSPASVSNYRKHAEREGYLAKVKEHEGRRKATEFRFNLELVEPVLPDEKQGDAEWGEIP